MAVARPPAGDLVLIAVAVAAVSTAAPLIREAQAPALAIAFWRNALAVAVVGPGTGRRPPGPGRRDASRRLRDRRGRGAPVGVDDALHDDLLLDGGRRAGSAVPGRRPGPRRLRRPYLAVPPGPHRRT